MLSKRQNMWTLAFFLRKLKHYYRIGQRLKLNYDELMGISMDNLTAFEDMCQVSYKAGKVVE